MSKEQVKLGFIGCGGIIKQHLEQGLGEFEDVIFAGWCDLDENSAKARREQVGGKGDVFTDPSQMIQQAKPDAVYIAIPPSAHGPIEELVLEHNIPFFVEKPVALDVETAKKIYQQVEQKNLITAVGFMNRYRDSVQKVKTVFSNQTPVFGHGGWLLNAPTQLEDFKGIWSWWVKKEKSGGQFLEQVIHTTDLVRYLFGEVVEVYATGVDDRRERPDFFSIEDAAMAQLKFENGAVVTLYGSCCTAAGNETSLNLWTTETKASFSGWEHSLKMEIENEEECSIPGEENIFGKENRAFIDAVKSGDGKGVLATYKDGYKATVISCAVNESMNLKQPIKLEY